MVLCFGNSLNHRQLHPSIPGDNAHEIYFGIGGCVDDFIAGMIFMTRLHGGHITPLLFDYLITSRVMSLREPEFEQTLCNYGESLAPLIVCENNQHPRRVTNVREAREWGSK